MHLPLRLRAATLALLLSMSAASMADTQATAGELDRLADRYVTMVMTHTPEVAYFAGLTPPRHDGLSNVSPAGIAALQAEQDKIWQELARIDPATLEGTGSWVTWQLLRQELANARARRVCRHELWNVNQMGGWQSGVVRLAEVQPVGTPPLREQTLARWRRIGAMVDLVTANLVRGLGLGYSAPKSVVKRVVAQLDGLLAGTGANSPLYSPAKRDGDVAFGKALASLIDSDVLPAIRRHRDYLAGPYLRAARTKLTVTANPDGLACYTASLQAYTTLNRSPREVFELGQATVKANRDEVIQLGSKAYGTDDFDAIMRAVKADPDDRFNSRDELLSFAREAVARAEAAMPRWVGTMPAASVQVVPFAAHEEGTGRSAHYNPASDDRPGEYRIPLHRPETKSRGNAEATAFHEAWPGHHLQLAFSRQTGELHRATKLIWFSGPGEGWARYAEALAEEMGLYETKTGPILRRAWPARGMVADPGLHVFGWSRAQVKEYLGRAGRIPKEQLDDVVDRIAILPGQLTAYDSGGLEILALRREAEQALGTAFDVRVFHDRILENGAIPLGALRQHIEAWLARAGT